MIRMIKGSHNPAEANLLILGFLNLTNSVSLKNAHS